MATLLVAVDYKPISQTLSRGSCADYMMAAAAAPARTRLIMRV